MTDHITIPRDTLNRLLDAWDLTVLPTFRDGMMQERMEDLRAELAKPAKASQTASQLAATVLSDCGISTDCTALLMVVEARIAQHEEEMIDSLQKLAKSVEQQLVNWARMIHYPECWDTAAYPEPRDAIHEVLAWSACSVCKPAQTPAWHDAPEVAALKAERDELLKLINRRKIHPHDFPLEIFIADLSTRTANVLRAEFDSFRHTDGTYDIEPPFTVRHLLMFSRQEIKKWPGIGKKGLNEIEENLRARGLQLWHAHDDRSLRLLREHKSYFVGMAKAEGEKIRAELAKPPTAPAWHDAPTCAGVWLCDEGDDNPYRWTSHRVPWPLNPGLLGENERWLGPMPEDKL